MSKATAPTGGWTGRQRCRGGEYLAGALVQLATPKANRIYLLRFQKALIVVSNRTNTSSSIDFGDRWYWGSDPV